MTATHPTAHTRKYAGTVASSASAGYSWAGSMNAAQVWVAQGNPFHHTPLQQRSRVDAARIQFLLKSLHAGKGLEPDGMAVWSDLMNAKNQF